MRFLTGLAVVAVAFAQAIPLIAIAQEQKDTAGMLLELNKLEDRDGSCRAYLVFDNRTAGGFDSFKLDLVVFGTDGVILRRLAVEAAPLRPEKRAVKLFDISGTECGAIGSVLVNDVLGCHASQGDQDDCIGRLKVRSRAAAAMTK